MSTKVVTIRPEQIKFFLFNAEYRRLARRTIPFRGVATVVSEFGVPLLPYDRTTVSPVETVEDFLFGDVPWDQTTEGKIYLDRVSRYKKFRSHGYGTTRDEVARYFSDLRQNFEAIRQTGWRFIPDDPVSVYLSRTGQFASVLGGRHRVRIAQLLDLPTIDVQVPSVHWRMLKHSGLR